MATEQTRLWLIDASYLWKAQQTIAVDYRFDYRKLRAKLEEAGPLWRAYYLNSAQQPIPETQRSFHTWLQSAPPDGPKLIVKLYELKPVRADRAYCEQCNARVELACPFKHRSEVLVNFQQKGVDVAIATLALIHRDEYDTLVLSSGDGDLGDAVEFLSEHGKAIELAVFQDGVSADLQARADRVYWIDDFADEVRREG